MENNLAVGIVLYNPEIPILIESINQINKITKNIYLVDNCSKNVDKIEKNISKDIILIKNKENAGIAKALNQILEKSLEEKKEYLITLDQDSILEYDAIKEMIKYVNYDNVAMICPVINDLNKKKVKVQKEDVKEIDRCITSGTLMILKCCKNVGIFDEKMFIDYVDFDYCKRIRNNGYKIIKIKNAVINHEVGKRIRKKFLFFDVYPTNHNENRIYYYARNIKYYLRKHSKKMLMKEKIREHVYLLWKYISIVLYEENKKNKLKMFKKGFKDFKNM